MKATLIREPETNKVIGYALTGETEEDSVFLNTVRNINFWGSPTYNGRISNQGKDDVKTLSWVQKPYSTNGLEHNSQEVQDLAYIQKFLKTL
jgi:hypothetical protein